MTGHEYIFPWPENWTRFEFDVWRERCAEMQGWCNEQGFNWYYHVPAAGRNEGAKFSFERSEDLTLFLLRWR